MLPNNHKLKKLYQLLKEITSITEKNTVESYLRNAILASSIDVNIMTKVDKNNFTSTDIVIEDGSDAVAALWGYANSNLKTFL
jgi:hypothetical protein